MINDKCSLKLFFLALLKHPFKEELINNKTLPISTKLVIVFWWSWTVIGGNFWSNQVSLWWERHRLPLFISAFKCAHSTHSVQGFSLFALSPTAYQLRTCQPPPPVANATILTEDDEFEIGLSYFICLFTSQRQCEVKSVCSRQIICVYVIIYK